ncbi:MAG: hypothetical protein KKB37_13480 [Alphaproteobacteria bacterium]|nr:hypothetical protein [Alphaproteobacteria bacterium]
MSILQDFKAPLLGALVGAIVSTVAGFTVGGWMTSSKADSLADKQSAAAVVSALAPICAANFKGDVDRATQLVGLKTKSEWEQVDFVEKGGWAKMPGSKETNRGVARACAEIIVAGK